MNLPSHSCTLINITPRISINMSISINISKACEYISMLLVLITHCTTQQLRNPSSPAKLEAHHCEPYQSSSWLCGQKGDFDRSINSKMMKHYDRTWSLMAAMGESLLCLESRFVPSELHDLWTISTFQQTIRTTLSENIERREVVIILRTTFFLLHVEDFVFLVRQPSLLSIIAASLVVFHLISRHKTRLNEHHMLNHSSLWQFFPQLRSSLAILFSNPIKTKSITLFVIINCEQSYLTFTVRQRSNIDETRISSSDALSFRIVSDVLAKSVLSSSPVCMDPSLAARPCMTVRSSFIKFTRQVGSRNPSISPTSVLSLLFR